MSLAINATTSSGIILAADSRQTYRNLKGMARIGSNSASKLFQLNRDIGCAITGLAFLPSRGSIKNIGSFIDEFKRKEEPERLNVDIMANKLHEFIDKNYDWRDQLNILKKRIKQDLQNKQYELIGDFEGEEKGILSFKFKDEKGQLQQRVGGVDKIEILIGGFNPDGTHDVYHCIIPGEDSKRRDSRVSGKEFGASWIGQTDVTTRIVLGWDRRIEALPFVRDAITNLGLSEVDTQLRKLEYQISWGTMTLQDAIDFCQLIIRTTEAIQQFSDGIMMDPGDIPGVGGDIDLAVITRDKGFVWVKKKNIKIDGKEFNIDSCEK